MKLFLFLLLFSFSAHAQTENPDVTPIPNAFENSLYSSLSNIGVSPEVIFGGFRNPNQIYSPLSPYCVEDNFEMCVTLGYTINSETNPCSSNGLACPYDETLWNCSKWLCKDLGLFAEQPRNMTCELISIANVVSCHKCYCDVGYIDYEGCEGLIETLTSDNTICNELGYNDSVTDCAEYLPCPSNVSRVRCLDTVGCKESDYADGCISTTAMPANAEPIYEEKACKCKDAQGHDVSKQVIVGWKCKSGYRKVTEGTGICIKQNCNDGEFEGPTVPLDLTDEQRMVAEKEAETYRVEDCYQDLNTASGWRKVATENKDGLQCYRCECVLPEGACKYSENGEGQYRKGPHGRLEDMCCDGIHYERCIENCPNDVHLPERGAVPEIEYCDACGKDKTPYIAGWHCNDGYILNENERGCDERPCPENGDGSYYREDYTTSASCLSINDGEGWNFVAEPEGAKHGEGWCGLCHCPYKSNDPNYKYTMHDIVEGVASLSRMGCNGKYLMCTVDETALVQNNFYKEQNLPAHAIKRDAFVMCDETYYRFNGCQSGYEYWPDTKECLPNECGDEYNIEGYNCPEGAYCSYCLSGDEPKTKVEGCLLAPRYKVNAYGTGCCDRVCDANDATYFPLECPAGKTQVQNADYKENSCGEKCVQCL